MNHQELFLKTVFACMACDGDIAPEEVQMLRELIASTKCFQRLDVERLLKQYNNAINQNGIAFLQQYLNEIISENLSEDEQMRIIELAFKTIEADHRIEYSEIKFFKKIRTRLSLTDETILARYPEKEDFLLLDIHSSMDVEWNDVTFSDMALHMENTTIVE